MLPTEPASLCSLNLAGRLGNGVAIKPALWDAARPQELANPVQGLPFRGHKKERRMRDVIKGEKSVLEQKSSLCVPLVLFADLLTTKMTLVEADDVRRMKRRIDLHYEG